MIITHPFKRTDEEILAETLTRASRGTSFTSKEITILSVTPLPRTDDAEVTLYLDTHTVQGESVVTFKRMVLDRYLPKTDRVLHVPWCTSIHDLLPIINAKYQIALKPSDVYDDPLPKDALGIVTITMTPHCLMWVGKVDFTLVKEKHDSNAYVVPGTLLDLCYPEDVDPTKGIAEINLGPINARYISTALSELCVNDRIGMYAVPNLALAFTSGVYRHEWNTLPRTVANDNLYGARVLYNGLNKGVFKTTNVDHVQICVLALSHWCHNYTGRLVLVYDTHRPSSGV